MNKFSVIGLGKLGACMAASFASRGFNIIGVDINQASIDAINEGRAPVEETGLADLIQANRARLKASTSHERAVLETDASFVIVPTPSDSKGAFSIQYAQYAMKELGNALKKKTSYHLIVMTSTVLPGACRHGLVPVLEKYSGKKVGEDFGFCYSPEFIALGSVIKDFLNPDFGLIGEFDEVSGNHLEDIYKKVFLNSAPNQRMSLENAELAKVALNSYVTMKISFANTIGAICENMPHGDVDTVTNAIGLDSRIGKKYLKSGFSYGGPCFPRDNKAFQFIARKLGFDPLLCDATQKLNAMWVPKLTDKISNSVSKGKTIAILGLSYKPASPVIEESAAIELANELVDRGYRIICYDPLANENARHAFSQNSAIVADSIDACLKDAVAVVVATPDPVFESLDLACFSDSSIFDPWRIVSNENSTIAEDMLGELWSPPEDMD